MLDKIQIILMKKTSISNNCILRLKYKNAKNGVTSTVKLALHKDLILKTRQIRVVEVKETTHGEAL